MLLPDKNKGITSITYNFLNLPERINFNSAGTNYIIYTYDATGQKLRKRVYQNNTLSAYVDYAGNFNYQNGVLQFFNHAEGYVQPLATYLGTDTDAMVVDLLENQLGQVVEGLNNDLLEEQLNNLTPALKQYARETGQEYYSYYNYVFQYKDHLGNVRLSYADSDGDGTINPSTEIIEESNYYPFGLKQKGYNGAVSSNGNSLAQNYKYNGKELNEELGLDWYDYGKRNYDLAIGRFFNEDRFAEKYFSKSPYQYAANNPIRYVDVKGDSIRVSGSRRAQRKFKRIIKKGLGSNYRVNINKQGSVTVSAKNSKSNSKLTKGQKAFLGTLNEAINNNKDTSFDLVDHGDALSKSIPVADNGLLSISATPGKHTLDVDDISKFGTKGKLTSSGTLGHEIKEGFEVQVKDNKTTHHDNGVRTESRINRTLIDGDPTMNPTRTEIKVNVTVPGGGTGSTVIIKLKDQNVTKLDNNKRN